MLKSVLIVVGSWAILKLRLDLLKNPLGIFSEPIFIIIIVGCLDWINSAKVLVNKYSAILHFLQTSSLYEKQSEKRDLPARIQNVSNKYPKKNNKICTKS